MAEWSVKISPQREIEVVISGAIAELGFSSAMNYLLPAVQRLCGASVANPKDRFKEREFLMWSQALKAARAQHKEGRDFDVSVMGSDKIRAHGMGISID